MSWQCHAIARNGRCTEPRDGDRLTCYRHRKKERELRSEQEALHTSGNAASPEQEKRPCESNSTT